MSRMFGKRVASDCFAACVGSTKHVLGPRRVMPLSGQTSTRSYARSKFHIGSSPLKGRRIELIEEIAKPRYPPSYAHLWKPLGFTFCVGCSCYAGAAVLQFERLRKNQDYIMNLSKTWTHDSRIKAGRLRSQINDFWNRLTMGDKVVACLVSTNLLIWFLWRIPSIRSFQLAYFTCGPCKSLIETHLLAFDLPPKCIFVFEKGAKRIDYKDFNLRFAIKSSTLGIIHLGLNMYVLHSFSAAVIDRMLGVEQFLGFYLTAGCVSSFVSFAYKVATKSAVASLGASGAILAVLTYTCCKMPDAKLRIVFLPFFEFSAESAIVGIVLFDLLGAVFRWKLFDHAAHLGGSLFGVWYALYGERLLWSNRDAVLKYWITLKRIGRD